MSRWTHVAAIFRLNSINVMLDKTLLDVFGEEVSYKQMLSYDEHGSAATLPMGSEGSLSMSIWHNPDRHCLASTTVSVFGDLRDFGDTKDIESLKAWFNKCCQHFNIRQAVMQIIDEWNKVPIIVQYNE